MSDPVVELSFFAGVDEATRDELVQPGSGWPELTNVRQGNRGAVVKRLGYDELPATRLDATTRTAGNCLLQHRGTPVVIDATYLDSYLEGAARNVTRSRVPECTYRSIGLPTPTSSTLLYDVEYCNGYAAVSCTTDLLGSPSVAIVEAATGSVVRSPEIIGSAAAVPYLASFDGRYFVCFCAEISAGIKAYILDTQALATGWTLLATVVATSDTLSVCSLSNRVAIAYVTTSGTSRVTVKTYDETGLLETRAINTSSVTPPAVSIDGSIAGTLWVAWDELAAGTKACGLDADALATTLASTAVVVPGHVSVTPTAIGICEGAVAGTARAWRLEQPVPTLLAVADITTVAGATTAGTSTVIYNVTPSSRPFMQGGRYYMTCFGGAETDADFEGNDQSLCIVVDWTDNVPYVRPIANVEPGLILLASMDCKVPATTTGKRIYGYQTVRSGLANVRSVINREAAVGCSLLELDFTSRSRWQAVEHAGSTFLGGGLLSVYDGNVVTEVGILVRPTKPIASAGSAVGLTGSYRHVAIYEDIDTTGNWTVSGISSPSDLVSVTNKKIDLATAPLTISMRCAKRISASSNAGTTRVAWYRTLNGGEPPYYRVGVSTYDLSTDLVTFVDEVDDADLSEAPKLYAPNLPGTVGESLDRRAPPGLDHVESYSGMLIGAIGESVFYSGQEVYGEATWFSPVFQLPVSGGGSVTAIKAQDGTAYIFKADRIFAVAGDAPTDNGAAGGLGVPRRLAVDVGCIDPASVVVTSLGIFFQSSRGIELLTRGGSVTWIGEKVQTTLAAYPVVTSAVLDDRNGLVRYTLAASESGGRVVGAGRDVIFDISIGAWQSVDDKTGSEAHQASQDAAMVYLDGAWRYAWLGVNGVVYCERDASDESAHLDGETWTTMRAVTPWVAIAGLNGEQFIDQILLLAKRHTDHTLTISVAFDFSDTYANSKTFTYDQLAALARQWLVREITQTTSQAVRIKLEDAEPTSDDPEPDYDVASGKGATWVALSFNGQPHRGPKRSSGAQRGG